MQATELPVLDEDRQLDADSCNPGEQQFEKLTAGLYMGDIARRIMLRFCSLWCIKHEGANRTILTCRNASQPCWHIIYEDMQSIYFSASVGRVVAAIRKQQDCNISMVRWNCFFWLNMNAVPACNNLMGQSVHAEISFMWLILTIVSQSG